MYKPCMSVANHVCMIYSEELMNVSAIFVTSVQTCMLRCVYVCLCTVAVTTICVCVTLK